MLSTNLCWKATAAFLALCSVQFSVVQGASVDNQLNVYDTNSIFYFQKPLSGNGAGSLINKSGKKVKLMCTSWPSHMETYLPEGLAQASLTNIVSLIPTMNINCVRFTFSIDFTRRPYVTGRQMATQVNITLSTKNKIDQFNPGLLDQSMTSIYGKVFDALASVGIMVIMDNHVSKATWCCGWSDGNGWPGDTYFNINDWVNGWSFMTKTFGSKPNVVGVSLRNEPRGGYDDSVLQKAFSQAALAVHSVNQDLMIIISSKSYESDLTYEMSNPIVNTFPSNVLRTIKSKIMYEGHHYSWFASNTGSSTEDICVTNSNSRFNYMFRISTDFGYPFYLSEWGFSPWGFDGQDPWFICLFGDLLIYDLGSSFWQLVPMYYLRNGNYDDGESWSLAVWDFTSPVSSTLSDRFKVLKTLQQPDRRVNSNRAIVHLPSARCLGVDYYTGALKLAPCDQIDRTFVWQVNSKNQLVYVDNSWCIAPVNENSGPVELTDPIMCKSTLQLGMRGSKIELLSNGALYCMVPTGSDAVDFYIDAIACDPNNTNQWFYLI